MAREGIYVGGKEITRRYVGTRLVWEQKLVESAHFENFTDWRRDGDLAIKRTLRVRREYGQPKPDGFNYEGIKARINGELFAINSAVMVVTEFSGTWVYDFIITFKNSSDRDAVDRIYQKDIYIYKKG